MSKIDNKKIHAENDNNNLPKRTNSIPRQIKLLCEKLEWRTGYLIKFLEQKNINKNENDVLTPKEFSLIKLMINSRLKAIRKKQKEENRIINSTISPSSL